MLNIVIAGLVDLSVEDEVSIRVKTMNFIYIYFISLFYFILFLDLGLDISIISCVTVTYLLQVIVTQKAVEDSRTMISCYMLIACSIYVL